MNTIIQWAILDVGLWLNTVDSGYCMYLRLKLNGLQTQADNLITFIYLRFFTSKPLPFIQKGEKKKTQKNAAHLHIACLLVSYLEPK